MGTQLRFLVFVYYIKPTLMSFASSVLPSTCLVALLLPPTTLPNYCCFIELLLVLMLVLVLVLVLVLEQSTLLLPGYLQYSIFVGKSRLEPHALIHHPYWEKESQPGLLFVVFTAFMSPRLLPLGPVSCPLSDRSA
ncbi:hypothetical protein F4778DRAFT_456051 [Xylariomycetidae sp. FL2044]|nr:hypothetical protein F4778DRAFT_456051 [Xylariomycetidae sp. FL2044]